MSNPWELKPPTNDDAPKAVEAGNHPAILVGLVDLGVQESEYKGVVSFRREVFLAWELTAEEDRPVLGRAFSFSLSPKANLGKWIAALTRDGRIPAEGVNLLDLLGKPCLLQVAAQTKQTDSGERVYNSLVTVSRLVKGMNAPKAKHTPIVVNLDDEIPDWFPRSYGRLLQEIREECAEKHATTKAKYEAWKKAPRKRSPAQNDDAGLMAGITEGADDEPF